MAGKIQNDLTGRTFGIWRALGYTGKSKYICKCIECGSERIISGYFLLNDKAPKCQHQTWKKSLKGKHFGEWEVIADYGEARVTCRCSCGTVREVVRADLIAKRSQSCGHNSKRQLIDLKGEHFGEWEVLDYNQKTGLWVCKCTCNKVKEISGAALRSGRSKSCGHATTGLDDLTDRQFNSWHVIKIAELQTLRGSTLWTCQCECGTIRDISGYALKSGQSKSCGCKANENRENTCIEKYGVKHAAQAKTLKNRSLEQLKMLDSEEKLISAIQGTFNEKPSIIQIAEMLGVTRGSAKAYITRHRLEQYATIGTANVSGYEKALNQMFPCEHRSDKTVLKGKELDLYYPQKKFAIEFNGNYWHSELKKDKMYHQIKTLEAAKAGVQIFHIFEYEWNNKETREKIIQLLNNKLYPEKMTIIHARDCILKEITSTEANAFIDKYHLQGKSTARINIGIYASTQLIGVITFSTPRFDREYEYELVRLAWKAGVAVVGGAERLFKFFVRKYKPTNIVSYCDISKFYGTVYTKLGFRPIKITQPNYKWVNIETNEAIPRYKTTKKQLIQRELGSADETEVEIMARLGYVRIYDSGNLKLVWSQNNKKATEGGTGIIPGK